MRVTGNTAYAQKSWGEASSFWKGGPQCDPVIVTQNVFGEAARRALNEDLLESMRPQIPPQPQSCVAASPFSDHASRRSCLSEPDSDPSGKPRTPVRARTRARQTP